MLQISLKRELMKLQKEEEGEEYVTAQNML